MGSSKVRTLGMLSTGHNNDVSAHWCRYERWGGVGATSVPSSMLFPDPRSGNLKQTIMDQ